MECAHGMCPQGPRGIISAPFPRNALMTCAHEMCSWNALVAVLMKYTHDLLLMNYSSHNPLEYAHNWFS